MDRNAPASQLFEAYADWGRDIQIILSHIKDPSRWSLHAVSPSLDSYVKEKVVLIGDAVRICQRGMAVDIYDL